MKVTPTGVKQALKSLQSNRFYPLSQMASDSGGTVSTHNTNSGGTGTGLMLPPPPQPASPAVRETTHRLRQLLLQAASRLSLTSASLKLQLVIPLARAHHPSNERTLR